MRNGLLCKTVVGAGVVVGMAAPNVLAQDCQPQIVGSIGGRAYDVAVVGTMAYVANGAGGLLTVDVSDPATMTLQRRRRACCSMACTGKHDSWHPNPDSNWITTG